MGWKDLFKSKDARHKPDPRVRWFGKLPTYADYYSSQTDEEWAVEYNDWILKGCELFYSRQRQAGGDLRLPPAACAVRLPKSQMTVFASLLDYGGEMRGRPFPLTFYVGAPSGSWPGPTSARILPALRLLRELTDLREHVNQFFKAPARFESTFGGREIALDGIDEETRDDSWRAGAQSHALRDWFAAAKPCTKTDDVDAWFGRVMEWGGQVAQLESEEFGPTLRFPLVDSAPLEVQVPGWLCWLGRRMALDRRLVSILFAKDPDGVTGHLAVVARELVPEDFLLLTPLASSLSFVDDLCRIGSRPANAAQSDGSTEAAVAAVRAPDTWLEFVECAAAT
jgi:hypothetical protein